MSGELSRQSSRDERALIFRGRTGRGQVVDVWQAGAWLDVQYYEDDETTVCGGFSLNPLYAGQLAIMLVSYLAGRQRDDR